ncbi:hypothetical protein NDU88_007471, partial [Pleurodeles waltl]
LLQNMLAQAVCIFLGLRASCLCRLPHPDALAMVLSKNWLHLPGPRFFSMGRTLLCFSAAEEGTGKIV